MTTLSDTAGVKSRLTQLVGHIRGLRAAVATIEGHLQESEAAIFALMEHHGVARSGEGLITSEERGS
jgi:hypothetical protein